MRSGALVGLVFSTVLVGFTEMGCSGEGRKGAESAAALVDTTGGVLGKTLYKQNCVLCHGINGDKCLYGARNLQQSTLSLEARMALLSHGRGKMPAFSPRLNAEQIEAVARWSRTLFRHAPVDSAAAN